MINAKYGKVFNEGSTSLLCSNILLTVFLPTAHGKYEYILSRCYVLPRYQFHNEIFSFILQSYRRFYINSNSIYAVDQSKIINTFFF